MANLDLHGALQTVGEELKDSVERIAQASALPEEIREKARGWAAGAAAALATAGFAKARGDQGAVDAANRELELFAGAGRAVAIGEVMVGITAAEAEGRARLAEAFSFGLKLGGKLLLGALL